MKDREEDTLDDVKIPVSEAHAVAGHAVAVVDDDDNNSPDNSRHLVP